MSPFQRPFRLIALLMTVSLLRLVAGEAGLQPQIDRLRATIPDLNITLDQRLGVAGHCAVPGRFLVPHAPAALAAAADPLQPARAFLDAYPTLMGGDSSMLQDAVVVRNAVDAHNGLRSVIWQQMVAGVPVHRGQLAAHLTRQGDLVSMGSHFVPDRILAAQRAALAARLQGAGSDGRAGLVAALRALGDAVADDDATVVGVPAGADAHHELASGRLKGQATARLVWYPLTATDLRLAWDLILTSRHDGKMYEMVVGSADGTVHEQHCLTVEDRLPKRAKAPAGAGVRPPPPRPRAAAPAPSANLLPHTISLRVFTGDSPTPMTPGWPTPSTAQPPTVARTLATLVNLDATASPNGWMDETLGDTRGNNVDAHADRNDDDVADTPRPHSTGTPPTFDFPCDLTLDPAGYTDAAVVNLFYWNNLCHDRLYTLGFTEAFGNFQNDNFQRGGIGNDAVQADAQDGASINDVQHQDNANFSTPPDGWAGRMQMYVFIDATPHRDGDFDANVIIHEYCHGLSNRLIGNGGGLDVLQAGGMGEGWSDFMSLCLLTDAGDTLTGTYPVGGYVTYQMVSANYYQGIRRYPYVYEPGAVTAASKNPLTFADIRSNPEVHDMGEVWCETLWEARANLITKLGDTVAGNNLIMQLVVDGMKLTPASPTFLQARDAILQADQVLTGGSNQLELWRAFAKRGMGYSAVTTNSDGTADVVESFDVPGDLRVSPATGITANGPSGGPFVPATTTYTLLNANPGSACAWSATANQPWLTITPAAGTLAAGQSIPVAVTFSSAAQLLTDGAYTATISFTNTTTGSGSTTRAARLRVGRNYICTTIPIAWIAPTAHTLLTLSDDSASAVQTLPFSVSFYGQPYTTLYVGSNGLMTFGSSTGCAAFLNTALPTPATPNAAIYAAWDDLTPDSGGAVRFGIQGSAPHRKAVVSWVTVPVFGSAASTYTMQIVLSEDTGDIVVNYLDVTGSGSGGISATVGIENAAGDLTRQFSYNTRSLSSGLALRYHIDNQPPFVVTPATAAINPLHGTSTTPLTVLGGDDAGEAPLTYTWSVQGTPPAAVVFAANGTHAAKASSATFTTAGTYTLRCTITDADGASITSDVSLRVIAPTVVTHAYANPTSIPAGGTSVLQVLGGLEIGGESSLTYTWSVLGTPPAPVVFAANGTNAAKTINATCTAYGRYDFQVTIADGTGQTVTDATSVRVNSAPTVVTPAAANPVVIHGRTPTALTVLGADDGGEPALTYTWSVVGTAVSTVVFDANGTNAARRCNATPAATGTWTLRCTITDAFGLSTTSDVDIQVAGPTIAVHAAASPATVDGHHGTSALSVLGADLATGEAALIYTWTLINVPPAPVVLGANGSNAAKLINATFAALGRYDFRVTIADDTGLTATDTVSVTVRNAAPTVVTAATAEATTTAGTTTRLTVLGDDDLGEPSLHYTWSTASGPGQAVFSVNGINAAKATTATFPLAGSYSLCCTITDSDGQTVTSATPVTVAQTLTQVQVTPPSSLIQPTTTLVCHALALDQFGQPLAVQPVFTWTLSGTTSGTINAATGTFTANAVAGGPYTITASAGAVAGTATLTVTGTGTASGGGGGDGGGGTCGLGSGTTLVITALLVLAAMGLRRRQQR